HAGDAPINRPAAKTNVAMPTRGRRKGNGLSRPTLRIRAVRMSGTTKRIVATSIATRPASSPIASHGFQIDASRVRSNHHTKAQNANTSHDVGIKMVEKV